jgi:type IV pilus assembly protein PilM
MGLFGLGKVKTFLGVDIGTAGAKLVQLKEEGGRAKLHTYAFFDRTLKETGESLLDMQDFGVAALKEMIKKSKCTATRAIASLPISSVFMSVLSVPRMNEKDQRGAIEVQARKIIPIPLEEMILDVKNITSPDEEKKPKDEKSKYIKVLLTAAPKKLVAKYMAMLKGAGFEVASIEPEAFSLVRSLVGKDKSTLMIIDIGALRTSVMVVSEGIPYLTRSIDVGGIKFTKAAAASLGVSEEEAEMMKADLRADASLAPGSIAKVFEAPAMQIVNEILFSLKLFSGLEEAKGKTIDKIILTGGGSLLPNLDAFISAKVNLRVFRGDPWARILYPDAARPALDEIGSRFSVAVGLAMREFEQ